jgi:hypothetical protein
MSDRDKKGRWLPGHKPYTPTISDVPTSDEEYRLVTRANPEKVFKLKDAILKSTSETKLQSLMNDLYDTAMFDQDSKTKTLAKRLYLEFVVGKATQQLNIERHEVETKVNIDLTKLTEQELEDMERLMKKTQPIIVQGEVKQIEHNAH